MMTIKIKCSVINPTTFQIQISSVLGSSFSTTSLQGRSLGNVFTNPYSARKISQVSVTHLKQCVKSASNILVAGKVSLPPFQTAQLIQSQVQITSSSSQVGVIDATLSVNIRAAAPFAKFGRIQIKSPPWYKREAIGQIGVTNDVYTESLITFDSAVSMKCTVSCSVTQTLFDEDTFTLTIYYSAAKLIDSSENLTISLSDFRNPVTQIKISGFQITVTDSEGYSIAKSTNLALDTVINQPQSSFNQFDMLLLGDQNFQNLGLVGTPQRMQLYFNLLMPLEAMCYFQFQFPDSLRLGQLKEISGTGIFTPKSQTSNVFSLSEYQIDVQKNTLVIQGCLWSSSLSANPSGQLTLNLVQIPNYVQSLDPIRIKVFGDEKMTDLVVDDAQSAKINAKDLRPGFILPDFFNPTISTVQAQNVQYFIQFRTQHDFLPSYRLVISMPTVLIFDRSSGCQVNSTSSICVLDPQSNTLTLTKIFSSTIIAGNSISLILQKATNPKISQKAGPWSISVETLVQTEWCTVDSRFFSDSFLVTPGSISSTLWIKNQQVSSSDTVYKFTFDAQHDIPRRGKLKLTFPVQTALTANVQVDEIDNFIQKGNTLIFAFDDQGITAQSLIQFTISNVQNPRSMMPSSPFEIITTDGQDMIIDSGGSELKITPNETAYFNNIIISSSNTTNGGIGTLNLTINFLYPLQNGDVLNLELPKELSFASDVTCFPDGKLVQRLSCAPSVNILQINLIQVSQTEIGFITVLIRGIKNPSSFRTSSPFPQIFTTDVYGYKSQQQMETSLTLTNNKIAIVQNYTITQKSISSSQERSLTLNFNPVNAISTSGILILTWSENVIMFQNTSCFIATDQPILLENICDFDLTNRKIRIQNLFNNLSSSYFGQIEITLTNIGTNLTDDSLPTYSLTTYDDANLNYPIDTFTFQPCASSCRSCSGSPTTCTMCFQGSAIPELLNSKCVGECPLPYISINGKCEKCKSPCASCSEGLDKCTSCDSSTVFKYRFGVSCLSECPLGTKLNALKNVCVGCEEGCNLCDLDYSETCIKCKSDYMLFEDRCYKTCPMGSILNFQGTKCKRYDQNLQYFPFLIITALIAVASWVGHKVKPGHLIFANFVVVLGFIEHVAMIVQIILSFIYGTYALAIPIILIWLGYLFSIITFNIIWYTDVYKHDPKFRRFSRLRESRTQCRFFTALGNVFSWKFHKLLYSRLLGIKGIEFQFSNPDVVEKLMFRITMVNIGLTFAPLALLNIIGLATTNWGTQLQVMFVENLVLALICSLAGIIEHRRIRLNFKNIKFDHSSRIESLKAIQEKYSQLFVQLKHEELIQIFGARNCMSDNMNEYAEKESDERKVRSWPLSPTEKDKIQVQNLPGLFGPRLLDNCYHEAVHASKLRNSQGFEQSTQAGGPFGSGLMDAEKLLPHPYLQIQKFKNCTSVVSEQNTEFAEEDTQKKGKGRMRGRKNRYLKQIDCEDYVQTPDAQSDNQKYLDAIEEEILKEDRLMASALKKQRTNSQNTERIVTRSITPSKLNNKGLPQADFRNFNEVDILGLVNRDDQGSVIVKQNQEGQFVDLNGRRVTAQGYLIDKDDDIISALDPNLKMFRNVLQGVLPAPFSFERFNFNPYNLQGNFKGFKNNKDPQSFIAQKDKKGQSDQKNRQVNGQGLLIKNGNIINQAGKVIFDKMQLQKDQLQNLYNYSGLQFSILEVMGVFKMNDQNEIIKQEYKTSKDHSVFKDISGHIVNEKGYLITPEGHICNRKGKIIFSKSELKNGEFPKIFSFSKFNLAQVTGNYELNQNQKPILKLNDEGFHTDDNGVRVNQHGYLIDSNKNIVDRNGNIMFERSLLTQDEQLPALFKNKNIFTSQSEDDLTRLLHSIGGQSPVERKKTDETQKIKPIRQHSKEDSSYGSEMDASPAKYAKMNQRPSILGAQKILKSSRTIEPNDKNNSISAQQSTTFNALNQSPDSSRQNSSRIQLKKKKTIQLVKIEKMLESDLKMAEVYGGEAVPRVRIIPKRQQTTQRERRFPDADPNSKILKFKKSANSVDSNNQDLTNEISGGYLGGRTYTQLLGEEPQSQRLINAKGRPSSPSNQAFSIKDRIQLKKQVQQQQAQQPIQPAPTQNQNTAQILDSASVGSDLDKELEELFKHDVDKFIDGSNIDLDSLSGFSGLSGGSFMSLSRHKHEQSKTKQIENEYLRKLEEQKEKHLMQQMAHTQRTLALRLPTTFENNRTSLAKDSMMTPMTQIGDVSQTIGGSSQAI